MTTPTKLRLRKPNPDFSAAIDPIEGGVEDIRAGRMVILVDDEDRENEGNGGWRV